jgi:hypothetical protein
MATARKPAATKPATKSAPKAKPKAKLPPRIVVGKDGWTTYGGAMGEAWEPKKKGDSIEGMVTSRKTIPATKKGWKDSHLVELTTKAGTHAAIWVKTTIEAWFEALEVGDYVRVVFEGMVPSKKKGQKPMYKLMGSIRNK